MFQDAVWQKVADAMEAFHFNNSWQILIFTSFGLRILPKIRIVYENSASSCIKPIYTYATVPASNRENGLTALIELCPREFGDVFQALGPPISGMR